MISDEGRALLVEYGLAEDERGFRLTLRGLQEGLRRAYDLREQGNSECAAILALDVSDARRVELALALQIEAFHESLQHFL